MNKPILSTTTYVIRRSGKSPVFGEHNITISADDEGGGMFATISQEDEDGDTNRIKLDFDELPLFVKAIKALEKVSKQYEQERVKDE